MRTAKNPVVDFETTITRLTELVEQMEKGDLPLETSLKKFEEGIQLIRHCQDLLQKAEQRVQVYNKANGKLENFTTLADNDQT